ncbi:MAG: HAD family hydrolase [Cyanobacteria bacterium P01_E01_bin.42]
MTTQLFKKFALLCSCCLLWLGLAGCTTQAIATDSPSRDAGSYLASWNDTATKTAIVEFVEDVTNDESGNFVEAKNRIAVFDNDGTLWGEYPNYFQLDFLINHCGVTDGKPENCSGEETQSYIDAAGNFVKTQNNPEFGRPYVDLIYRPMVELLDYLRANDFQVYICSGGEIDFIRGFAEEYYGIPPQNIVGSTLTTTYQSNPSVLVRADESVPPPNDQDGKPVGIERYIGKRPILAVGNSDGDLQMLEYTDEGQDRSLMLLLRHDDFDREGYAEVEDPDEDCAAEGASDGPGTYCHADEAIAKANSEADWYLISVTNDFDVVFLGD